MRHRPDEGVDHGRARRTTCCPFRAEHHVIDQQLRSTLEQVCECLLARICVERVLLVEEDPRLVPSLPAELFAHAPDLVLALEQSRLRFLPLLARRHAMTRLRPLHFHALRLCPKQVTDRRPQNIILTAENSRMAELPPRDGDFSPHSSRRIKPHGPGHRFALAALQDQQLPAMARKLSRHYGSARARADDSVNRPGFLGDSANWV